MTAHSQTLPKSTIDLATLLGFEIGVRESGFVIVQNGDVFYDDYKPCEVDAFLSGYLNGRDDAPITSALDELVLAEQIIQTLTAQLSDAQRDAATASLVACGFPVNDATRCVPRLAAIAAARATVVSAS